MTALVSPAAVFKDNLALLPAIAGVARVELVDGAGSVVAVIPNEAGKQGSLAVYAYLAQGFPALDAAAAEHGLALFAEHVPDARARRRPSQRGSPAGDRRGRRGSDHQGRQGRLGYQPQVPRPALGRERDGRNAGNGRDVFGHLAIKVKVPPEAEHGFTRRAGPEADQHLALAR